MLCKRLKFSSSTKVTFTEITVFILVYTLFTCVVGVPINFPNNNNNVNKYPENYANRPLPHQPHVPPPQRQPGYKHQQQQQNSQNQGPEMEDFGRLHMNHNNQFRRHANAPLDVKVPPGGTYQNYPSEQFGRTGDSLGTETNFRHNQFDDSYQQQSNHNFRHQPPSSYSQGQEEEEVQGFYDRSNDQGFRQSRGYFSQDTPPTQFPGGFNNNPYREEAYPNNQVPPNQQRHHQQRLNDNEIYRERNVYSQAQPNEWERANPFSGQRGGKSPVGRGQDEQPPSYQNTVPPHAKAFMEFPASFGKPNNVPALSAIPKPPTAFAIIVPGVGGNSTLFIEYDVNDNDVTYETVMEVEDVPDSLVHGNSVTP